MQSSLKSGGGMSVKAIKEKTEAVMTKTSPKLNEKD